MTQHQFPRSLDLHEAAQDALRVLENIKLPHPELITRRRGMSRQEHEDIVSSAIEEIEMHTAAIENLRAAIVKSERPAPEHAAASQWQSIETAPMHQIVLVSVVGAGVTFGSRIGSCGWTWEELDDEPADAIVSHWMPLPTPPATSN